MKSRIIGILALQGDFSKHAEAVKSLSAVPCYVRHPQDLEQCDALIIPGGESTTISKQTDFIGLRDPIINFSRDKPLFGTCAGLIMMGKGTTDGSVKTLGILDIEVIRNGYGAQYESFSADIMTQLDEHKHPFHAVFIRGPRINSTGPDVKILAYFKKDPVLIQQGHCLAAAFHPELTDDLRIHRHFLKLIGKKNEHSIDQRSSP